MSGGPRPPVPGLIPLAALSRRPGRPRRRPESIDAGAGSHCLESRAAAPSRRRHHRRRASAAAAVSKQSRSSSPALERPPRVNPIFVWVRQEDTRIVDVKCEDYDKRNRILLTKTAHGWRAIPRTEMLGAPRVSAEEPVPSPPSAPSHGHHHRHHHKRRSRKSKNQQSTSVQFPESEPNSEPSWVTSENVNIESLLPSHTIKRIPSSEDLPKSVNTASEQEFARTIPECSTPDKVCDVSPLENLLAVAELELKQHMQSGNWNSNPEEQPKEDSEPLEQSIDELDEILKTKSHEIEAELINSDHKSQECSYNDDDEMSMNDILSRLEQSLQSPHGFGSENTFDDEILENNCKFDKEFLLSEENSKPISNDSAEISDKSDNYDMEIKEEYTENDLIDYPDLYSDENKMTQILEAVKCLEPTDIKEDCTLEEVVQNETSEELEHTECKIESTENAIEDFKESLNNNEDKTESPEVHQVESNTLDDSTIIPTDEKIDDEDSSFCIQSQPEVEENLISLNEEIPEKKETITEPPMDFKNNIVEAESSTVYEQQTIASEEERTEEEMPMCLDLSIKNKPNLTVDTDKEPPISEENDDGPTDLCIRKTEPSSKLQPPRPLSQNSEAIQSPQPSGIPAIPASPDIVSTSSSISKPRSIFLESLLANSMNKTSTSSVDSTQNKPKEPLDLGQCRKSASPTVTCSEEIITPNSESEPPLKKLKPDDITLKHLLDKDIDMLQHSPKKISPKEISISPDTPRLLSLLKASSDTQDPLAEYKQLLLEIDIPNPLMVPKDVFPDLLKHPRREILKILSGHSSKNVALDDILVVYKDKLLAAIQSSQNNSTQSKTGKNSESVKTANKPTNKATEQNNHVNERINSTQNSNKRKSSDVTNKNAAASPDNKNSLANDIDAANEAALNPLFWAGCPNPFEAMNNYSNHNEFIQALYAASSLPYLPGQLGELHPGLQMMLGNKMAAPLGFSPIPHLNFNNQFELSMWQEAMMQASLLKTKNPYENATMSQPHHRTSLQKKNHAPQNHNKYNSRMSNGHTKNISQSQQIPQQTMIHPSFNQTTLNNQPSWQNPYLGLGNFPQGNNNLALDTTQFNPFSHKNNLSPTNKHNEQLSPPILQKKNKEANLFSHYNEQEKRLHHHMIQEHQKMQQIQQQKLMRQHQHQHLLQQQQQMMRQSNGTKPLLSPMNKATNSLNAYNFSKDHLQGKISSETQKQGGLPAPIDLSGVQGMHSKARANVSGNGKTNGMVTSTRNLMEDIPEVGSTTGSIEDMQDSHAQLWHPLFGRSSSILLHVTIPHKPLMSHIPFPLRYIGPENSQEYTKNYRALD